MIKRLLATAAVAAFAATPALACDGKAKTETAAAPAAVNYSAASFDGAQVFAAGYGDKAEKQSIAEIAAGDERFSTLVAALTAADLVDTFAQPGEYTVFAPTNDAFAALPAGTVESLLEPANKDQLTAVLTYHVLGSKVKSDAIAGNTVTVATLNGAEVTADGTMGGVKINNANVIIADIGASNGVIHAIDAVLLPPAE